MVQGYGRTHGSDARERRQCGSGGATAAHRGESSRRDDGEAARRPFHAGPVPNQRCHCQDTARAQQGRLLADGRRREPRLQGAHSGRCPVRAQGRVESDGGDGAHTGVGEGHGEVSAPPGRLQGILDTAGRPVEHGFDLTPDACDGSCFHLVQKGNLRIEIHFAAPLAQTVNVVVYGESEAVLEIDKGRNIIYDH